MSYNHIQNRQCYLLQVNMISSLTPSNLKPITTSTYSGIVQSISMLDSCQFFIAMGITCQNKVVHFSHSWIHTLKSSILITTIASHHIEVSNLGSWPNNNKYGEKDEREACWLNLYPIASHGNCNPILSMALVDSILPQTMFHHLHHPLS
jgi:hypothetical protein